MNEFHKLGVIHVADINLWAHVGVLEQEQLHGQHFLLDFKIWLNVELAADNDDLSETVDYSIAIKALQHLALDLKCKTIETFSDQILNCLEDLYGQVPVHIFLRKCAPPIAGFNGTVGIERFRYLPPSYFHR
jgi:dihydroneopterin aldolase